MSCLTTARLCLVDRRGVEPRTPPCKGGVFPSIPAARNRSWLFAAQPSKAGVCKLLTICPTLRRQQRRVFGVPRRYLTALQVR